MSHLQLSTSEEPPDRRLSELEIERSSDSQKIAVGAVEQLTDSQGCTQAGPIGSGLSTRESNNGSNESDGK
jgi:hypothetical protein